MIYLDSSSFLKLLWPEPESPAVRKAIEAEARVVVSPLAVLETEVQLRAQWLAGGYTKRVYTLLRTRLDEFRQMDPFDFVPVSGEVFSQGLEQHRRTQTHCRTLDRLHLACMEELELRRLMTHDAKLAHAARSLDFEVLSPL